MSGSVFVVLDLTSLDGKLTLRRFQFFALLSNITFILSLRRLQLRDFIGALLEPLIKHLNILQGVVLVTKHPFVASFKISMR